MGDEYESPSQCYNSNTHQDVSHVNDSVVSRPTGRALTYEQPAESGDTEVDANIQALADFITKSKQGNDRQQHQYVDLPNTAPHESGMLIISKSIRLKKPILIVDLLLHSEMVNTEQHEVIGWRDPSEIIEDTPKRNPRKNVPCFSISCTSDEVKNKLVKQIISLKGKTCENLLKYDDACTHFVCEKPSRSEKMLSCVAAGKWVLGLSYIQKSFEANRFLEVINCNEIALWSVNCSIFMNLFIQLQEEEFEWGNPRATDLPRVDGNDLLVAQAAHRWRKKLQSVIIPSAKGIFKDFRVILKTAKNESMRTLIEAGRGQIIESNPE